LESRRPPRRQERADTGTKGDPLNAGELEMQN
jgi:hypothetical protein